MNDRFKLCMALIVTGFLAPFAAADQPPTYQEFDAVAPAGRRLRVEPYLLSRFPTTFTIAASGDGKQLRSVDIEGRVWQWSARELSEPELIAEVNGEPACAVLSDDASLLAFADPEGGVSLMDIKTRQIRFRRDTADRTVTLLFSPDRRMLAGATVAGKVHVWDVGGGRVIRELETRPSPVQTLAFSPNSANLAISSLSQTVALHRIGTVDNANSEAPERRAIDIGGSRVTALAYTPDGTRLVIAAADGTAKLHDVTTDREPVKLGTHPFAIWSLEFDATGERMAAGSWDGTIRLWNTKSWQLLQSVKTHEESVAALAFVAEQGLISAGLDGRLLHWLPEVRSIGPSAMIAGRADSVWVAVYSPGGKKLFVGGGEYRFELWDVEQQELLVSREGHPTTRCAVFSPDSKTLATGGDKGKIFLSDSETGKTRKTLLRHPGAVSAVVFADGGKTLVSGCDRGFVKVWDTATGQEAASWKEHKQQVYCANISLDGKWLITGGGNWTTADPGELLVWELPTGRLRARVKGHSRAVWAIAFTPDGKQFASSDSSGAVKVWNLATLKEERTLQHAMWIRALALSPDGTTLAVGRGDGSVRLWDTTAWTQKAACDGHDGFTFWLQYAPSGETLATSGNDGTVRFWRTQR